MRQQQILVVLVLLATVIGTQATVARSTYIPLTACLPGLREHLPTPYRRICETLAPDLTTLFMQLAEELKADEKLREDIAPAETLPAPPVLQDDPIKREGDVPHVFFRFGRRQP